MPQPHLIHDLWESIDNFEEFTPKKVTLPLHTRFKIPVVDDMVSAGLPTKSTKKRQPVMLNDGSLKDLRTRNVRTNFEELRVSYPAPKPIDKVHARQFDRSADKHLVENSWRVKPGIQTLDFKVLPEMGNRYAFYGIRERSSWQPGKLGPVPGLTQTDLRRRVNVDKQYPKKRFLQWNEKGEEKRGYRSSIRLFPDVKQH